MSKMVCAMCREEKDRLKKNTHYLTDGIIRNCLNLDGSGKQQAGFYADISNDTPFMDFNFQRNTSIAKLEEALGRPATEEEIEKAKEIPFSVDDVFCDQCEKIFTDIETKFIAEILPKFRNADLSNISEFLFEDVVLFRKFLYIQVFRTAICEEIFKPNEKTIEDLRKIILHTGEIKKEDINHYPISVTYLQTVGDPKEYTKNIIGFSNDENPYLIFFNDFIIQFFDNIDKVRYRDLFGLLSQKRFEESLNYQEDKFKVIIESDDARSKFLYTYATDEKVKDSMELLEYKFIEFWKRFFFFPPSRQIIDEFKRGLIGNDVTSILKFSAKAVTQYTFQFVMRKLQP